MYIYFYSQQSIELQVDNCRKSFCLSLTAPHGKNEYLNVNGPLQVGGAAVDLNEISKAMNWNHKPMATGFAGCISNLTFNGKVRFLVAAGVLV